MRLVTAALMALVNGYRRWITPYLPARCRFEPSCSTYAVEALAHHGGLRGSALMIRRLARCHPWSEGGIDPVPGYPAPARPRREVGHG